MTLEILKGPYRFGCNFELPVDIGRFLPSSQTRSPIAKLACGIVVGRLMMSIAVLQAWIILMTRSSAAGTPNFWLEDGVSVGVNPISTELGTCHVVLFCALL